MGGRLAEEGRLQEELCKHIARGKTVFVFVLNFLSATDPPSARQKAARRNGGPVGESNLEVFLVDSSCALFWDV